MATGLSPVAGNALVTSDASMPGSVSPPPDAQPESVTGTIKSSQMADAIADFLAVPLELDRIETQNPATLFHSGLKPVLQIAGKLVNVA